MTRSGQQDGAAFVYALEENSCWEMEEGDSSSLEDLLVNMTRAAAVE